MLNVKEKISAPYIPAVNGEVLGAISIKGLNAPKKFAGQILAALALVPFGFLIKTLEIPFIGTVHLGFFFGIALTIVWMVAITNAFNLIDGMDGLSSGVTIIASIILVILSILYGKLLMTVVLIAVLGSTLGFLWHNWHPAKIFMGDCGAMFLGFLSGGDCGWCGVGSFCGCHPVISG